MKIRMLSLLVVSTLLINATACAGFLQMLVRFRDFFSHRTTSSPTNSSGSNNSSDSENSSEETSSDAGTTQLSISQFLHNLVQQVSTKTSSNHTSAHKTKETVEHPTHTHNSHLPQLISQEAKHGEISNSTLLESSTEITLTTRKSPMINSFSKLLDQRLARQSKRS